MHSAVIFTPLNISPLASPVLPAGISVCRFRAEFRHSTNLAYSSSAAAGKCEHERRHGFPRTVAQAFRLVPSVGNERLPCMHVAGVIHRTFVHLHQIPVLGDPHDGNTALLHLTPTLSLFQDGSSKTNSPVPHRSTNRP